MISEFDNKKSRRRDRRLVQYNTSKRVAYCPVTEYDSRAFISFVKYLSAQDKTITIPSVGQTVSLGSAKVTFVGHVDMTLAEQNENNASLIVRIEYGQTSFLFTGDAEIEEELSVVHSEQIIQSTLLKVGHHGSYTSSSEEFLKAVSPKYAIISVGKDNGYGHPHEEAMNRIQQYCDTALRTDVVGEIPFRQIVFAIRYSIHFPAGFFKVRSAEVFGRNTNQAFSFICVSSQQRLSDKRERITAHMSKH